MFCLGEMFRRTGGNARVLMMASVLYWPWLSACSALNEPVENERQGGGLPREGGKAGTPDLTGNGGAEGTSRTTKAAEPFTLSASQKVQENRNFVAATADTNLDRITDIVVAGQGVQTMLGNGRGGFAAAVNVGSSFGDGVASSAMNIAAGDFGSGRGIFIVPGPVNSRNGLWSIAGPRAGTTTDDGRVAAFPLTSTWGVEGLALGDFDGNGQNDLAVAANVLSIAQSNNGRIEKRDIFAVQLSGLKSADMNGDSKPDLVGVDSKVNKIVELTNSPGVIFTSSLLDACDSFKIGKVLEIADFNDDRRPDVAVLCDAFVTFAFLETDKYSVGVTNAEAISIASADFDGDGDIDLVAGVGGPESKRKVRLLRNRGGGDFESWLEFKTAEDPYIFSTADFNGDGHPDLGITAGTTVQVFLNTGLFP
jgi:FG-GAP-like repeat